MGLLYVVAALCAWMTHATTARAHTFSPSLLAIHELPAGAADVMLKTPRLRVMGADVRPELPASCRALGAPTTEDTESAVTLRWRVDCGADRLSGRRIGVAGLATANTNALIRVELADGRMVQRVVTIDSPSFVVPAPPPARAVASDYGRLGMVHVFGRLDRLVFVLGLLLLVPSTLPLLQTLAAFTVGHSVTLAAAALGLVVLPPRPVELVVAVTMLVLATELAREPSRTLIRRFPWIMGFSFGLLHGLGFAAALCESGLPPNDASLAVLSFNVGIELAQLSFVCLALTTLCLLRAIPRTYPVWARQLPLYVMGSLAAFWCFERASALLR